MFFLLVRVSPLSIGPTFPKVRRILAHICQIECNLISFDDGNDKKTLNKHSCTEKKSEHLLSFEHGNPISHKMYNTILLLFVRIQSSFFQPEVLYFLPIYFPQLCPYLESLTCFHGKDLIVKCSIFVCTS